MKFAIGKKVRMDQVFDEEGMVHPVTMVELLPMTYTKICHEEKEGYSAVQIGYGTRKKVNKAQKKGVGGGAFEGFIERTGVHDVVEGTHLIPEDIFVKGDVITVSGISKGKGFQGVVKRYGFAGGPRTHGQKHSERSGGSVGGGLRSRVPKGMKMPGRMGGVRVTTKGLRVIEVDKENKFILVQGSIPGRRGSIVEIKCV